MKAIPVNRYFLGKTSPREPLSGTKATAEGGISTPKAAFSAKRPQSSSPSANTANSISPNSLSKYQIKALECNKTNPFFSTPIQSSPSSPTNRTIRKLASILEENRVREIDLGERREGVKEERSLGGKSGAKIVWAATEKNFVKINETKAAHATNHGQIHKVSPRAINEYPTFLKIKTTSARKPLSPEKQRLITSIQSQPWVSRESSPQINHQEPQQHAHPKQLLHSPHIDPPKDYIKLAKEKIIPQCEKRAQRILEERERMAESDAVRDVLRRSRAGEQAAIQCKQEVLHRINSFNNRSYNNLSANGIEDGMALGNIDKILTAHDPKLLIGEVDKPSVKFSLRRHLMRNKLGWVQAFSTQAGTNSSGMGTLATGEYSCMERIEKIVPSEDIMATQLRVDDMTRECKDVSPAVWEFFRAVIRGDRINIYKMMIGNENIINSVDTRGNTPLHYAAKYNNMELVDFFLNRGVNPSVKNVYGSRPIDMAMRGGYRDIVHALYAKDPRPEYLNKQDR